MSITSRARNVKQPTHHTKKGIPGQDKRYISGKNFSFFGGPVESTKGAFGRQDGKNSKTPSQ